MATTTNGQPLSVYARALGGRATAAQITYTPPNCDLTLYAGDGATIYIRLRTVHGEPVSLEGGRLHSHIRRRRPDPDNIADWAVSIDDLDNGEATLTLTGDQTAALMNGERPTERFQGFWDLEYEPEVGEPITLVQGRVTCDLDVTRPLRIPRGRYADTVIADRPTCYFRLGDSGRRNVAVDEMGGPPGEYFGEVEWQAPNLMPEAVGRSARFGTDGDSGVIIPDSQATRLGDGPMSVEFWLRPEITSMPSPAFMGVADSGPAGYFNAAGPPYRIWMRIQPTNPGVWHFTVAGSFGATTVSGLTAGFATHVVFARDDTEIRIYGNGVLLITGALSATPGTISSQGVLLASGRHNPAGGLATTWLRGQMQEFALYDYALTSNQISDHFATALQG